MFMTKDGVIENLLTNQRTFEEEVRASTQRFDDVDWDVVLALTPAIKEQDQKLSLLQNDFAAIFKRFRQKTTDIHTKYDNISELVKSLNESFIKLEDKYRPQLEDISKNLSIVCEYMCLQVAKDEANDADLQSIGLIGVQERGQSDKKNGTKDNYFQNDDVLQLNSKCFNCFGTTGRDKAAIIQLFKTACLNYQPSSIRV